MNFRFRPPFAALRGLALALLVITALPAAAKPAKVRDIYDTIAVNPILTNFATLLKASDLGTFLSSRGPFTAFVPTDSAFAKLAPGIVAALLRPENKERLQHIVLYHIINGQRIGSMEMTPLKTIPSCEGTPLQFRTTRSGAQLVMKSKIVHSGIHCENGVINEIDTLLMPPETALPPLTFVPTPDPNLTTPPATSSPLPKITNASEIPVAPIATPGGQ